MVDVEVLIVVDQIASMQLHLEQAVSNDTWVTVAIQRKYEVIIQHGLWGAFFTEGFHHQSSEASL